MRWAGIRAWGWSLALAALLGVAGAQEPSVGEPGDTAEEDVGVAPVDPARSAPAVDPQGDAVAPRLEAAGVAPAGDPPPSAAPDDAPPAPAPPGDLPPPEPAPAPGAPAAAETEAGEAFGLAELLDAFSAAPPASPEDAAPVGLERWLPALSGHGPRVALQRVIWALVFVGIWSLARRWRTRLRPMGLVPRGLWMLHQVGRVGAVLCGLAAATALLPAAWSPMVTLALLGGALAAGWSLRDLLGDLLAGVELRATGRVRPGQWVRGSAYEGVVRQLGLRVTVLDTQDGETVLVPHRALAGGQLTLARSGHPEVTVDLQLDPALSAQRVRAAAFQAVSLSPWVELSSPVDVSEDGRSPGLWRVRARVVEGRFAERFSGSLPARIRAVLAQLD